MDSVSNILRIVQPYHIRTPPSLHQIQLLIKSILFMSLVFLINKLILTCSNPSLAALCLPVRDLL